MTVTQLMQMKHSLTGNVLCARKLGLPFYDQRFGVGTGAILLDDVVCVGNETSLTDCQRSQWGVHNCDHFEDVSVMCLDNFDITGIDTKLMMCSSVGL